MNSEGIEKILTLRKLSDCSSTRGNLGTAQSLVEHSIQIVESIEFRENEEYLGRLYLHLGTLEVLRRHYSESITHFNICLRLFRKVNSGYTGSALRCLADAYAKTGDLQLALQSYDSVIESLNPENDLYDFRRDSHAKGLTLMRLGDWDGALGPLLDARKTAEKRGDLGEVFDEDTEISHCLFKLGNAEDALCFAEYAMEYALSSKSADCLFWAFTRYGNALYLMGKLEEAEEKFVRALENLHKDYDLAWELLLLSERNLAKTLLFRGKVAEAEELFRRMNTLAEILGDEPLHSSDFQQVTSLEDLDF